MDTFIHQGGLSLIEKDGQRLEAFLKPEFSFEYDDIQFHQANEGYVLNNNWNTFTADQRQEIVTYIEGAEADPQTEINLDNLLHLSETDWYVTRFAETGVAIPQDILDSRAAARAAIVLDSDA